LEIHEDGGILVDKHLKTSIDSIYAAGDICHCGWDYAPQWFQVRLFIYSLAVFLNNYLIR
jgi:hypothetical protein